MLILLTGLTIVFDIFLYYFTNTILLSKVVDPPDLAILYIPSLFPIVNDLTTLIL